MQTMRASSTIAVADFEAATGQREHAASPANAGTNSPSHRRSGGGQKRLGRASAPQP